MNILKSLLDIYAESYLENNMEPSHIAAYKYNIFKWVKHVLSIFSEI